MGSVVIDEVEVEAMEREERSAPQGQSQPRERPKLDPNELAAVLMKHAERLQRLWAD